MGGISFTGDVFSGEEEQDGAYESRGRSTETIDAGKG
jgi:hypothetical protein